MRRPAPRRAPRADLGDGGGMPPASSSCCWEPAATIAGGNADDATAVPLMKEEVASSCRQTREDGEGGAIAPRWLLPPPMLPSSSPAWLGRSESLLSASSPSSSWVKRTEDGARPRGNRAVGVPEGTTSGLAPLLAAVAATAVNGPSSSPSMLVPSRNQHSDLCLNSCDKLKKVERATSAEHPLSATHGPRENNKWRSEIHQMRREMQEGKWRG